MLLFILHCQLQITIVLNCPILKFQPEKWAFNYVKSVFKSLRVKMSCDSMEGLCICTLHSFCLCLFDSASLFPIVSFFQTLHIIAKVNRKISLRITICHSLRTNGTHKCNNTLAWWICSLMFFCLYKKSLSPTSFHLFMQLNVILRCFSVLW